jgi:hypothetical protein
MATTLDQTQPSERDVRTLGAGSAAAELPRAWEGFADLGWRDWRFSAAPARALSAANAPTVISTDEHNRLVYKCQLFLGQGR